MQAPQSDEFARKYRSGAFHLLLVLALVLAGFILVPFIPAILWATVLSILMYPVYKWSVARMAPNLAAALTTFATLIIVAVPLSLIGLILTLQINESLDDLRSSTPAGQTFSIDFLAKEADTRLAPAFERLGSKDFSVAKYLNENRDEIVAGIRAPLARVVVTTGFTIFTLVIALLTMFFMVRDARRLLEPALDLLPVERARGVQLLQKAADTVRAVFVGVVLVAVLQGIVAGIGYAVTGVPNPVVWMFATMVLCTIPLLGSPFVYVPWGLILIASGRTWHGVGLLALGFLVVSNIDNLLRPFVIGAQVKLHPMSIFFSLLGGVLFFGPVGLMAGPMLLTVILFMLDVLREQIRPSLNTSVASDSSE
jgi:predicted PurR-regulated permease PerM